MKNQKLNDIISVLVVVLVDMVSFIISILLATSIRQYLPNILDISEFNFLFKNSNYYFYFSFIFIFIFFYEKLYTIRLTFWDETKKIIKGITLGIIITLALITLGKSSNEISRLTILITYLFAIFIFPISRYYIKKILYGLEIYSKRLIIVSDNNNEATFVEKALNQESNLGYKIEEIVLFKNTILDKDVKKIAKLNASGIVVVCQNGKFQEEIINKLQEYTERIFFLPSSKNIAFLNSKIEYLFDSQLFIVKLENNLNRFHNKFLKNFFDKILAILLMPLLLPIILLIALFIRFSTKRSAFFIQKRLGESNHDFSCIKFQTMYPHSDNMLDGFLENNQKEREYWKKYKKIKGDDPRVTQIGKFLRKTSLDELPQIFNVLMGNMSFVGPRPYLAHEIPDMRGKKDTILIAKPGITGMWQVMGRNELSFQKRVELDEWYVRNWSLWFDIVLLFKTIKVVLVKKGAY